MDNKYYENNKVFLNGTVLTTPQYSHTVNDENFYIFKLQIPRLSDNTDTLNVTVSERFFITYKPRTKDCVIINGQFRSYNNFSDVGSKLILTIFVKDMIKVLQTTRLQAHTLGKRSGGHFDCSQPRPQSVRLYPLYRLGPKR